MAYIRKLCHCVCIQDMPEEILERIMSYLSPYSDCKNTSLVSRKWHRLMQGVIKRKLQAFHLAARSGSLRWSHTENSANCVHCRSSHSACCVEGIMYMFGGMIPSTTVRPNGTCFCDLRMLDLGERQWTRLMPTGEYPSPKASASMVHHNGSLILFGGFAPPVPNPPYQPPTVFNDLHIYDIAKNNWKCIVTSTSPPPLANHGASMMGDLMIIFGGGGSRRRHKENDVWVFSNQSMTWSRMEIEGGKPHPRDKHVQVVKDDGHILIIGGLGNLDQELCDVWMLDISEVPWCWREVEVKNPEYAARNFVGHAACKIGECVVIFNTLRKSSNSVGSASSWIFTQSNNRRQQRECLPQSSQSSLLSTNQRGAVESGFLRNLHPEAKRLCTQFYNSVNHNSEPSTSDTKSESGEIGCPCSPECHCKTPATYTLRTLNRRPLSPTKLGLSPPLDCKIPYGEQQYVLDISKAVEDRQVEWLVIPDQNAGRCPKNPNHPSAEIRYGLAPEALFPSICVGRAEIIRFGGMLMDRSGPRPLNDQYYAF